MNWELVIGFFVALLAILNPLSKIPLFIAVTAEMRPGVRRAMALLMAGLVLVLLMLFLFTGQAILDFFGISLPAFQVAGGLLLLLSGLVMVSGVEQSLESRAVERAAEDDFSEARARMRDVMIPLAVPLSVGPGTISVAILYSNQAKSGLDWLGLTVAVLLASVVWLVTMLAAVPLGKALGENVLQISNRIFGLIITAIGVQFILVGLAKVTTIFDMKALGL